MIPIGAYLVLAAFLFCIGLFGLVTRRNIIIMFMCVELMLNSVNLTLVAFGHYHGQVDGQIMAFFVMVVAAAEVTVGLALIVNLFRLRGTVNPDRLNRLKA